MLQVVKIKIGSKLRVNKTEVWTILKVDFPRRGRHLIQDQNGERYDVSEHVLLQKYRERPSLWKRIFRGRK